eukprot:78706_1
MVQAIEANEAKHSYEMKDKGLESFLVSNELQCFCHALRRETLKKLIKQTKHSDIGFRRILQRCGIVSGKNDSKYSSQQKNKLCDALHEEL